MVDRFPSIVASLPSSRTELFGKQKPDGFILSVDGMHHFVGKDAPKFAPGHGTRAVVEDFSATPDYRLLFLGSLAYICQYHGWPQEVFIEDLVLGLPLSTLDQYTPQVQKMAVGSHDLPIADHKCTVHIARVSVAAQPQGALTNFGRLKNDMIKFQKETSLVLDMGGGTFDWFASSSGLMPNPSRCGAAPTGMLACAGAACDVLDPDFRKNPNIVQRVDDAIRKDAQSVRIAGKDYQMDVVQPAINKVVGQSIDEMLRVVQRLNDFDNIIVTGGGAKRVHHMLASRFPKLKGVLHVDEDPVNSNVKGFHVLAETLNQH